MNTCCFTGHLTEDPVVKHTPDKKAVANFTLAVPRDYRGKDGVDSDAIKCVAFGPKAEPLAQAMEGMVLAVTGSYRVRTYKQTQEHSILVQAVEFVSDAEPKFDDTEHRPPVREEDEAPF